MSLCQQRRSQPQLCPCFQQDDFGINKNAIDLVRQLQQQTTTIIFVFGNPYAMLTPLRCAKFSGTYYMKIRQSITQTLQ